MQRHFKHYPSFSKEAVKVADIAASFQEAVIDVLAHKLMKARDKTGVSSIVLAGGVACNQALRKRLRNTASEKGVKVYYPRPAYCTDNGAMIAYAGCQRLLAGAGESGEFQVKARWPMETLEAV